MCSPALARATRNQKAVTTADDAGDGREEHAALERRPHEHDIGVDLSAFAAVDDGLEVGAPAGDQGPDAEFGLHQERPPYGVREAERDACGTPVGRPGEAWPQR